MATYFPGSNVALNVTFTDADGAPVTPSPVTVTVTDPAGQPVTVGTPSFATTGNGQAITSVVTGGGEYQVIWTGEVGGFTVTYEYQFTVRGQAPTSDPLAWAVMVAYCGWDPTVLVTDETVNLDGNGKEVLALPSLNVTAVSAVTVTDWDGSTWTPTVGASQQVGWSKNGILTWNPGAIPTSSTSFTACWFGPYWPEGQQNIAVTYSGGYDGPDAFLDAALNSLTNRLPQMGRTSARLGSAGFTYAASVASGGLLLVEQMVFDRYRLPRVA